MKNIFSIDGIFLLILLILFTAVLHLPSLHPDYFASDESIYYLIANKLSQGKLLYLDVWDHKPPVLYWIYWLYYELLGEYSLMAMRITGCVIILFLAVSFNIALYDQKFISQYSARASFLMILLLSLPWHIQETNAEIWVLIFWWIAVLRLWRIVTEDSTNRNIEMFWIGFVCGLAVTIKYQGIFLYAAILLGYLWASRFVFAEVVSFHIGMFIFPLVVVIVLYIQGVLAAFWEVGFIYNFSYITEGILSNNELRWNDNLFEIIKLFGIFLVLAGIGFLYYRSRIFSFNTKQRKIEILMFSWFIFAFLSVLVGGKRLYPHYFYLLMPPVVFYLMIFHQAKLVPLFKKVGFTLALLYPIFSYSLFSIAYFDELFEKAAPYLKQGGWTSHWHDVYSQNLDIEPLKKWLKNQAIQEVWIPNSQPELYLRLRQECAVKYIDPVMLRTGLYWANSVKQSEAGNWTFVEHPEQFFVNFQLSPPTCIIEREGFFGKLRDKIPLLLAPYRKFYLSGYSVYYLENKQRLKVSVHKT